MSISNVKDFVLRRGIHQCFVSTKKSGCNNKATVRQGFTVLPIASCNRNWNESWPQSINQSIKQSICMFPISSEAVRF